MDKLGTAYEDSVICTGYGAYMATPLLRAAVEKNPNMSEAEARDLVKNCMEVLFYRDARSYPKYQLAVITSEKGAVVEGPFNVLQNWNLAYMIH